MKQEMCGTTYSSLQFSNALNSELASLYTVPLSAIDGLSLLTKLTTSKGAGTANSIRKFLNQPIPFESNWTADSNSNLEASQVLPISWYSNYLSVRHGRLS